MSRKPIHLGAAEPSYFYVLMAQSCFRRAASTRHPKAGGTLRQIGRDYLVKANATAATLAPRSSPSLHASAH